MTYDKELAGRPCEGRLIVSARESRCLRRRPSFAFWGDSTSFLIVAENGIAFSILETPLVEHDGAKSKHVAVGHMAGIASDHQTTQPMPVAGVRRTSLTPSDPSLIVFSTLPQGERYIGRLAPSSVGCRTPRKVPGYVRVLGYMIPSGQTIPCDVTYSNERARHPRLRQVVPSAVTERVFTDPHNSARELGSFPILAVKCEPETCPVGLFPRGRTMQAFPL